ncbi:MAG: MerR family DNA-binding transcriptional regulator [Pseudomonadota bacterium]|uniref:MerR family transcriptional regulator n=1 Tax=Polaromonas sp. TaxID=1869339 RepID=UPI0017EE1CA2|nr:MerR family transcriptional regulator [Polaromonas sp.]MBA3595653.1 MerR family DNA-binding transcriptional regulator [Polaromonas sp.]MDQ3271448.1 MerR family DNA-binding transcriptional regulator [Pseudomonadota bacterium]
MQISQLATQTGVSVHALRHYEKLGMLQPARRASGYRDYTEAMRREVVFIAMSRRIGFSLKAIAAQLPAYRSGRLTFDDMLEAMQQRVADIDAQIIKLQTQRRAVVEHVAWMKKRQREHLARKAQAVTTPARPPWPVVTKPRKRTPA